ncbi:peroxisomal membrane protein 2 [Microplitis mediator]|uniref:peroxisomal membrane protein 2 n=1 Tax=Microplitis mediator TaxID=375433 RepID=UPI002555560B|nr:peroxisomal membrane protein 2 [Microplitis mediator]
MSLSKPSEIVFNLVASYMNNLYNNPIKTKAITSCLIATFGNYIAQKTRGVKEIDHDVLSAYGLFGLLFGGPVPHYFYKIIYKYFKHPLAILLIERLLYTPCFQVLSLYMLSRFEGKSHQQSCTNLQRLYWPVLSANLKYLTLLQFINIRYVPPMLKVLVVNIIGLAWTIYLANVRASDARRQRRH